MAGFENLVSQAIVQRLGWTLLHFVWQGTAAAALLAAILWLVRRRSANARYMACCAALLLMVALPVATFSTVGAAEAARAEASVSRDPLPSGFEPLAQLHSHVKRVRVSEPEQKEPLSFGPLIERVLVGDKTRNTIDLECGELFPWPLPVVLMGGPYPRAEWFTENGIDAMLGFSLLPSPYDDPERALPREARGETASGEKRAELWAFNSTIVPLTNESWDRLGPEVVFPTMASGPSRTAISIAEPLPRTYLFATREGGKGVLQIVQLVTDEPQRVRIRYKMFERSPGEVEPERGSGPQLSFGPGIERVVYDDEIGKNNLIDLDTGDSFMIQKFFARYDTPMTEEQKQEFCKQNGVDMAGEVRHVRSGLWLVDSAAVPIVDEQWNRISPEQVVAGLRSAKPDNPTAIRTMCTLPRTCLFKTREGGIGVLRIMKPAIEKPEGIEIRYKLVRSVTADKP